MEHSEGIAVGLKRGHKVEKRTPRAKPSHSKGKTAKRVKMIRSLIREVSGFAPYERRAMEILKQGGATSEKRALRFCKRRLGGHKRGLKKRSELQKVIVAMRSRG